MLESSRLWVFLKNSLLDLQAKLWSCMKLIVTGNGVAFFVFSFVLKPIFLGEIRGKVDVGLKVQIKSN